MSRTVARLLAESLEAHDVDQVYCVPGGAGWKGSSLRHHAIAGGAGLFLK